VQTANTGVIRSSTESRRQLLPHRHSHLCIAAHLSAQSVEVWERLPDRVAIDLRMGTHSQHDTDCRVGKCDELAHRCAEGQNPACSSTHCGHHITGIMPG